MLLDVRSHRIPTLTSVGLIEAWNAAGVGAARAPIPTLTSVGLIEATHDHRQHGKFMSTIPTLTSVGLIEAMAQVDKTPDD